MFEGALLGLCVVALAWGIPFAFILRGSVQHEFDRARAMPQAPHVNYAGEEWYFAGDTMKDGREGPRYWRLLRTGVKDEYN